MPGIYVHIPFCARKCSYCDFYSRQVQEGEVISFLQALEGELRIFSESDEGRLLKEATTLYVGGGTPTCLREAHLERLFSIIGMYVRFQGLEEVTVEANPGTLAPSKAALLINAGITRVSLGAQSFDDGLLAFLGRIHRGDDIARSFDTLREAGLENVNLDLIYGVPGEDENILFRDLERASSLRPEHLSLYALTVEEGTPLAAKVSQGTIVMPGDDAVAEQYDIIRRFMAKNGFDHYEVSNFASRGFRCLHNLGYWTGEEYAGFGPSAAGYLKKPTGNPVRYVNTRSLAGYVKSIESGTFPRTEEVSLSVEDEWKERLMLGLRLTSGIDVALLESYLGPPPERVSEKIESLISRGFLTSEGTRILIPEEHFFAMNEILSRLI